MSYFLSCFRKKEIEMRDIGEGASRPNLGKCKISRNLVGSLALTIGLISLVVAIALASGVLGVGLAQILAGCFAVATVPAFIVAAIFLSKPMKRNVFAQT